MEITIKQDTPFIITAKNIVLTELENEDFSLHELSDQLCLSRSQVHRKIKSLTGMSTTIFIRHIRLRRAKELLHFSELSISEIAYRVGFKSPVYFSQIFKETFDESPTEARK